MSEAKARIKTGRAVGISSFLIGAIIISVFFFTYSFLVAIIGLAFIGIATIANLGIFSILVRQAIKVRNMRKKSLSTAGLLLLNIPVMLVYCNFALTLMNTVIIKFTNDTGSQISDVNIIGCEGGYIEKLDVNESKTVWVAITGDCSIDIDYLSNGERKSEEVAGYVTLSNGARVRHSIDGKDKAIFF